MTQAALAIWQWGCQVHYVSVTEKIWYLLPAWGAPTAEHINRALLLIQDFEDVKY